MASSSAPPPIVVPLPNHANLTLDANNFIVNNDNNDTATIANMTSNIANSTTNSSGTITNIFSPHHHHNDTTWMWQVYPDGREETTMDVVVGHLLPMLLTIPSIVGCYIVIRESYADVWGKQQRQVQVVAETSYHATAQSRRGRRRRQASSATTASAVRSGRQRRGNVFAKQLISLSVAYLMFHFVRVLGPVPAPSTFLVWAASGNLATCELTGFFGQLGLSAAAICTTLLVWFYTLSICHNVSETELECKFLWSNIITWTVCLVVAVVAIPLEVYNFTGSVCWVDSFPAGCGTGEGEPECIRGGGVGSMFQTIFTCVPYWPCLIAVVVLFVRVYRAVRRIENRASIYAGSRPSQISMELQQQQQQQQQRSVRRQSADSIADDIRTVTTMGTTASSVNRTKSKAVGVQAMLFIGAYVSIMVVATLNLVIYVLFGLNIWMEFLADVFFSLPGFFNFLIFIRPRAEMKTPEGRLMRKLVCRCGSCCNVGEWGCVEWVRKKMASSSRPPRRISSGNPKLGGPSAVSDLSSPGDSVAIGGQQKQRSVVDSWGAVSVEELYASREAAAAAAARRAAGGSAAEEEEEDVEQGQNHHHHPDLYSKRIDGVDRQRGPTSWGVASVEEVYAKQDEAAATCPAAAGNDQQKKHDPFCKRIDTGKHGTTSWGAASVEELYAQGVRPAPPPNATTTTAVGIKGDDPFSKRIDTGGSTSWGVASVEELYAQQQQQRGSPAPKRTGSTRDLFCKRIDSGGKRGTTSWGIASVEELYGGGASEVLPETIRESDGVDDDDDDVESGTASIDSDDTPTTSNTEQLHHHDDDDDDYRNSPAATPHRHHHLVATISTSGSSDEENFQDEPERALFPPSAPQVVVQAVEAETLRAENRTIKVAANDAELLAVDHPGESEKKTKKKKKKKSKNNPEDNEQEQNGTKKKKKNKNRKKNKHDRCDDEESDVGSDEEQQDCSDDVKAGNQGERKEKKKTRKKKKKVADGADDDDDVGDGDSDPVVPGKKKKKKKTKTQQPNGNSCCSPPQSDGNKAGAIEEGTRN